MSIVINPYNFGGFHSKVLMLDLKSNLKLHSSYNLSWNNARLHVDIFHCAFKGTVALFTYNVKINRTCLYTEPHLKNITSSKLLVRIKEKIGNVQKQGYINGFPFLFKHPDTKLLVFAFMLH